MMGLQVSSIAFYGTSIASLIPRQGYRGVSSGAEQQKLQQVEISLNDYLTCSGCITKAQ